MRIKIATDKWKALLEKGGDEAVRELGMIKAGPSEIKAVEGAARTLLARASTAAVDRDNDTIAPAGWQLGNFANNGPILWAHDAYSCPPIARSSKAYMDAMALWCEMMFPDEEESGEHYKFSDSIYRLAKARYLNAVSVGFMPIKWVVNETRGGYAIDFLEQELLELSIVPIPSNPEALIEARSAGKIDLSPIVEWTEKFLEGAKGPGLWVPVPKKNVEAARKAMLGNPVSLPVNTGMPVGIELANGEVKVAPGFKLVKLEEKTEIVDKRGRVLSASNENALRDAAAAADTAIEKIKSVLAQVEEQPVEDAAPAAQPKSESTIAVNAPAEDLFADEMRAMLEGVEKYASANVATEPQIDVEPKAAPTELEVDGTIVLDTLEKFMEAQLFAPAEKRAS